MHPPLCISSTIFIPPLLTGVDAAVLQVLHVARLPERLWLRPARLPRQRARQRHGVELGRAALERPL